MKIEKSDIQLVYHNDVLASFVRTRPCEFDLSDRTKESIRIMFSIVTRTVHIKEKNGSVSY